MQTLQALMQIEGQSWIGGHIWNYTLVTQTLGSGIALHHHVFSNWTPGKWAPTQVVQQPQYARASTANK